MTETTILQHGCVLRLGNTVWRFIDPGVELQHRHSLAQMPGVGAANMSLHGSTATLPGPGDQLGPAGMRSSTANYVALGPGQQPRVPPGGRRPAAASAPPSAASAAVFGVELAQHLAATGSSVPGVVREESHGPGHVSRVLSLCQSFHPRDFEIMTCS